MSQFGFVVSTAELLQTHVIFVTFDLKDEETKTTTKIETDTETETETENVPDIPDELGNSNHYVEGYRLTVK